ncbi:MAG: ComEA family DNA-binding protein [Acidobacteria bacterium]|nr:ComEA family DNA-binding protein [Acidobacteriota bacterium]
MRSLHMAAAVCNILFFSSLFAETAPPRKIDLNTANLSDLEALPGVGPVTAEKILRFRIKNGPFKRVEELMNVRGIGERKFRKLKPYITVSSSGQRERSP